MSKPVLACMAQVLLNLTMTRPYLVLSRSPGKQVICFAKTDQLKLDAKASVPLQSGSHGRLDVT